MKKTGPLIHTSFTHINWYKSQDRPVRKGGLELEAICRRQSAAEILTLNAVKGKDRLSKDFS